MDGTVDSNEVVEPEHEDERIMGFLTYGPNAAKYNYKHYGRDGDSEEKMVDEERKTRSGRVTRGALSKFTTWDGANTRPGLVRQLRSTDNGNPVIVGLIDKVMRENMNALTEGEKLAPRPAGKELGKGEIRIDKGRIRVELRLGNRPKNKVKDMVLCCKNKERLREILLREKVWKVSFKEL